MATETQMAELLSRFLTRLEKIPLPNVLRSVCNSYFLDFCSENKKSRKRCSNRVLLKAFDKRFSFPLNGGLDGWIVFSMQGTKIKNTTMRAMVVFKESFPGGSVYYTYCPHWSNKIFAFTGHFFDRLIERTEEPLENREDAVKQFCWWLLKQQEAGSINDFYNSNIVFKDGMGLGESIIWDLTQRKVVEHETENSFRFTFVSTMISNEMMSDYQSELKKSITHFSYKKPR